MALGTLKNLVKVTLSTGYNSAATSVVLNTGDGAKLPTVSFNAVWWDASLYADPADDPNVEIIRVTNIAVDTLTISRAQESTSAANHNAAGHVYKMIVPGLTAKGTETLIFANDGTGNVGFYGVTPVVSIDTSGASAYRMASVTLGNGLNSNINIGTAGSIRVTGPTGAFSVGGFTGGQDGRMLILRNAVGQQMTIVNTDASSAAGNQILTSTGSNVVIADTNGGSALFIYDATSVKWVLVVTQ